MTVNTFKMLLKSSVLNAVRLNFCCVRAIHHYRNFEMTARDVLLGAVHGLGIKLQR